MVKVRMHPVSIDELLLRPKMTVDIHVQLSNQKFILVAKAGASTPVEHFNRFKAKGVNYMYVKPEDYITLVQQTISVAGMAVGSSAIDDIGKLNVLEEALASVLQEIQALGIDEKSLWHAKLVSEAVLTVVAGTSTLSQMVASFASISDSLSRHALLVSLLASLIGQAHEWVKIATFEKLALGGLLHDIGKQKLPSDIVFTDPRRIDHDGQVIYRSHAEIGRHLLSGVKGMPEDVILIVYEHHELADGSGFPRKIKDFQISPLARVVALANAFAHLVTDSGQPLSVDSAHKAFRELEMGMVGYFNKDAVKALHRLLDGNFNRQAG